MENGKGVLDPGLLDTEPTSGTGAQLRSRSLVFDRLNTTVTSLDLYNNALGECGGQALAEILRLNATLASLNLGFNGLGEGAGRALAEALRLNNTLASLDLRWNDLGDGRAAAPWQRHRAAALTVAVAPPACCARMRTGVPAAAIQRGSGHPTRSSRRLRHLSLCVAQTMSAPSLAHAARGAALRSRAPRQMPALQHPGAVRRAGCMRQGPAARLTSAGTGVQMPKAPPKRKGRGGTAARPAPPLPEQVLTRRWPPSSMALRKRASAGERTRVRVPSRRAACRVCAVPPSPSPARRYNARSSNSSAFPGSAAWSDLILSTGHSSAENASH